MTNASQPPANFGEADILLLERTADALSAWWGKPVMAELGITDDVPWVVFGLPLDVGDDRQPAEGEFTVWQMGGEGTRRLGNAGGLAPAPDDIHDCRLLWAIQVSPAEGERYLKLDGQGRVVAWSDDLSELLPFEVDLAELDADPYDDEDDGEDEDGGISGEPTGQRPGLDRS